MKDKQPNNFAYENQQFHVAIETHSKDGFKMETSVGFEIKGPDGNLTPDDLTEDQITALNEVIGSTQQELREAMLTVNKASLPPVVVGAAIEGFAAKITNPAVLGDAFGDDVNVTPIIDTQTNQISNNDPLAPTATAQDGPEADYSWHANIDAGSPEALVEQVYDAKPIPLPDMQNS